MLNLQFQFAPNIECYDHRTKYGSLIYVLESVFFRCAMSRELSSTMLLEISWKPARQAPVEAGFFELAQISSLRIKAGQVLTPSLSLSNAVAFS